MPRVERLFPREVDAFIRANYLNMTDWELSRAVSEFLGYKTSSGNLTQHRLKVLGLHKMPREPKEARPTAHHEVELG